MTTAENSYEVIIVGGSYAGLSTAMTLGRAVRRVLIIDSGKPCNRPTPRAHNFITHDGSPPAAVTELARAQVLDYPTVAFRFRKDSGIGLFSARRRVSVSFATVLQFSLHLNLNEDANTYQTQASAALPKTARELSSLLNQDNY